MKKGFDFTGVSIVYFCHDGNGNVLLSKRNQNCRDEHGCWDQGGGGLKFGEKVENGLQREIQEEYCADIIESEFLGFRDVHREHNGQKTHWIALDFKVKLNKDAVKNGEPEKHDEIKWFPFELLPEPLHSQLPHFLNIYKNKLF